MTPDRVPFPVDKRAWHPSLLPGPLALVTTVDGEGVPNVAPKSFLQMVSFEPPILMFSGQPAGRTERNLLTTGCFGVSLVHGGLAERVFACTAWSGAERIERAGLHLAPADAITAPLVAECRAHLECRLHDTKAVGSALVVFGEIVAASLRADVAAAEPRQRYAALDQALYLEEGLYATVDRARPATPEPLSAHTLRFAYFLSLARPERFDEALIRAHVAHLKDLEERGLLELCGPFPEHRGGMVILRGVTEAEARAIAAGDPFVTSGAETCEVRRLEVSCRENRHLGMG